MNILPHISSIYANSWIGWVLVALMLLGLLSSGDWTQGDGQWTRGWYSIFSSAERTYTAHTRAWGNEICAYLFRLGVLSIAVWVLVVDSGSWAVNNGLIGYAKVLVVALSIYILQRLTLHGVGYVFISHKQMDAAIEQYNGVRTVACICLYLIVLIITNITIPTLAQILCGGIMVAYIGTIVWKSMRLFYINLLSLLYVILYIVFLEIVPIMMLLSMAKKIISL